VTGAKSEKEMVVEVGVRSMTISCDECRLYDDRSAAQNAFGRYRSVRGG